MSATAVKPSHLITFHDRLSRLSFEQACKLLGPNGRKLIIEGSKREVDLNEEVFLGGDLFRVTCRGPGGTKAIATLTAAAHTKDRLVWNCDHCEAACEHVGALFSVVLEYKSQLGLAAPPPERKPAAELTDEEVVARALAERTSNTTGPARARGAPPYTSFR